MHGLVSNIYWCANAAFESRNMKLSVNATNVDGHHGQNAAFFDLGLINQDLFCRKRVFVEALVINTVEFFVISPLSP